MVASPDSSKLALADKHQSSPEGRPSDVKTHVTAQVEILPFRSCLNLSNFLHASLMISVLSVSLFATNQCQTVVPSPFVRVHCPLLHAGSLFFWSSKGTYSKLHILSHFYLLFLYFPFFTSSQFIVDSFL